MGYLGVQVGWLRNLIGPPRGSVRQYLHYGGMLDPLDASIELALRLKCLLLVSVCLKQRSLRHATAMPAFCICTVCVSFLMVGSKRLSILFYLRMFLAYQALSSVALATWHVLWHGTCMRGRS